MNSLSPARFRQGATLALALGSVLVVSVGAAQDEPYQSLIAEAVAEFEAHRFEEARVLFRRAHEVSPNARTLRGIGLASFEMRDYVTAYRTLALSIASDTRPLTDAQRAEVASLLERTARFVGLFDVVSSPGEAQIRVDRLEPQRAPDGRVLISLGPHVISVSAPDHDDVERALRVLGGEEEELRVELTRSSAGQESEPLSPAARVEPIAQEPDVGAVVLVVVGGAASVGSVVTGVAWWASMEDELAQCAPPAMCANTDEVRSARDAAAGTTIALGAVGLGLLLTGAILLATSEDEPARGVARCAPGAGGLVCAGRF